MSTETPKPAAVPKEGFSEPRVVTYSKNNTQTPTLMETTASNPSITASKKCDMELQKCASSNSQRNEKDENIINSQDKRQSKKSATQKMGKSIMSFFSKSKGVETNALEESLANLPSTPLVESEKKSADRSSVDKDVVYIDHDATPLSATASPPPSTSAPPPTPASVNASNEEVEIVATISSASTTDDNMVNEVKNDSSASCTNASIDASQNPKKAARRRPKKVANTAQDNLQSLSECKEIDGDDNVTPALHPEVEETIGRLNTQRSKVLSEFLDYEVHEDYNDCHEGSLSSVLVPLVVQQKDEKEIADIMKAYYIQGSKKTLSELIKSVADRSASDLDELKSSEEICSISNLEAKILRLKDTYFQPNILKDQIKSFAERKMYASHEKGSSDVYEDTDEMSILRWEVFNLTKFDQSRQGICKEARHLRKLYGKLIVATSKLMKEHEKLNSVSGLDRLEDARNKANQAIEKAKQAKEDSKQKKADDEIARQKKEEEKENARRKKEEEKEIARRKKEEEKEIARRKKEEKDKAKAEEKVKVAAERKTEKAPKESQKKQPQLGSILTFLSTPKVQEPKQATASPSSGGITAQRSSVDESKLSKFSEAITSNMRSTECQKDMVRRFRQTTHRSRKMRKPVRLTVTVEVPADVEPAINAENGDGAFAHEVREQETYSELREISLDSRMKYLMFHEDMRPPYRGTYSKKSTIISGRAPFKKDEEKLNYEYDSEAEWSDGGEEEGGEDLAESDGEDDGEPDDLVYDEFFKRDDEETSDLDSDGEGMASVRISRKHQKQEYLGPYYITPHLSASIQDEHSKKEISRLRSYPTILYDTEKILGIAGNDFAAEGSDDDEGNGEKDRRTKDFPEVVARILAKFITGKKENQIKLAQSFHEQYHEQYPQHPQVSKGQVKRKISEIATKRKHPDGYGTSRWVVDSEYTQKLEVEGVDSIPYTPPKHLRKKKARKPKEERAETNDTDVTSALIKVMESMSDSEAAIYIARNWDVILKTTYPWSLLRPRLETLEWEVMDANSFSYSYVHVPSWAKEKYLASGCKPGLLTEHRDYFVDQDDIRNYILKYGCEETDAPVATGRSRKRDVEVTNSLSESPFIKALEAIKEERKLRESQAQAESLKRKLEIDNDDAEESETLEDADDDDVKENASIDDADDDEADESSSSSREVEQSPTKSARQENNNGDDSGLPVMEQDVFNSA